MSTRCQIEFRGKDKENKIYISGFGYKDGYIFDEFFFDEYDTAYGTEIIPETLIIFVDGKEIEKK